ncbi:MAG: acyltransferase [Flavobacteriales bacterium]|nr:acyltransferase [Flavobacteriales bacterium]
MSSKSTYIPGFDGIRALAVLLVVGSHAGLYELLPESFFWHERVWRLFSGESGVLLFFTLSGFLITMLLQVEKEKTGSINYGKFMIRRLLRLVPALVFFLLVVFALDKKEILLVNREAYLAAIFYYYNFLPQVHNVVELTHTWSLGVEEQFYLTWPLLVKWIPRNGLPFALLLVIVLSVVLILIFPFLQTTVGGKSMPLMEAYRPLRWLFPAASPIAFGALMAHFRRELKTLILHPLVPFLALFFWISPLYLPEEFLLLSWIIQGSAAAIMLGWIYCKPESTSVQFLEFAPMNYLGKISYGFYLWQGLFLRTGPGSELWFQQFPQNCIGALIAALISYYLIERYFLKLKDSFR